MSDIENGPNNSINEDDGNNERERLVQKCSRLEAQLNTLKEVSSLRKSLLELREQEVKDLIGKLKIFEGAIENEKQSREQLSWRVDSAEKTCAELTAKLQANIENLAEAKNNYEEKIGNLVRELEKSDQDYQKRTDELNDSELRNIELNSKIDDYGKLIADNDVNMKKLQEDMKVVSERNRVFSYQMNLLNTLFNETEGTPIDFERIKAIGDIVRESQNMPCLMETPTQEPLLSRRTSIDYDALMDHVDTDKYTGEIPGEESCYKKVSTLEGPQLVLSVSQTFIKLKDLILEKKHLHKEIDSLKQLNGKLESKVDRQEKRLYVVTTELNKTWNLVAKLKMQHNKLHNSEAVLKYELHEKRKLLERLKTELSKSRQQWAKVREKHDESEILCQRMRAEFARRRQPSSQESGAFSDTSSPSCSSPNEEINEIEEPESETVVQEGEEEEDDVDLSGIERGFEIEVDPLEDFVSDLVQEIEAATSSVENENEDNSTAEEDVYMTNRANRLRQLEDASRVLYSRLMATTVQSSALASRLAQLHDHYGSHDGTAPGTDVFQFEIPMEQPLQQVSFDNHATSPTGEMEGGLNRELVYGTEQPQHGEAIEVLPVVNVELFQNGSEENEHIPVMTMTQNAEALIVEMESPALLAELAVSRIESRSPVLLQSTTTQVFDLGINHNTHNNTTNDTSAGTEAESQDTDSDVSPDTNSLSRLIIQQVPKRLEILKKQNASMRDREKYLMQEVHDQRSKLDTLEKEKKNLTERLEEEIIIKNVAIEKLQNEMADLVATLRKEKEKLSEFMKLYLEEKSDLESPEVPSASTSKTCRKCTKKFSILGRRRHHCYICKQSFCRDCTTTKSHGTKKTVKVCSNCTDRKVLLDSTAQSLL